MKKRPAIGIGINSFYKLITGGYYYVDKTELIMDLVPQGPEVTLFTRPRRFGKSLAISMLAEFFDITKKEQNVHLFDGLKISEFHEICREHQNAYPVISLSFKDTRQPNFKNSFNELTTAILDLSGQIKHIIDKVELNDRDVVILEKIRSGSYEISDLTSYLRIVTKILNLYYGKKVIVLLDEYDVPIQSAFLNGFYDEMMPIILSIMSKLFKDNTFIQFGVITGCLRFAKESIFTGMNNFSVNSVLTEKRTEYFGFTPEETQKLLEDCGVSDRMETAKTWYDGYRFGKNEVYNPWSILQYAKDAIDGSDNKFQTYWMNTSENDIFLHLVDLFDQDENIKTDIENLINGKPIIKKITESTTFNGLNYDSNNIWFTLLFTGYLKPLPSDSADQNTRRKIALVLPNEEVKEILVDKIEEWFNEKKKTYAAGEPAKSFFNGDAQTAQREIGNFLRGSISVRDEKESFYHGVLTALLKPVGKEHQVFSNRESGDGYPDIIIKDDLHNRAVVIEIKKATPSSDSREAVKTAFNTALDKGEKQIKDREYLQGCLDEGYKDCLCYTAAFCSKECRIRKIQH